VSVEDIGAAFVVTDATGQETAGTALSGSGKTGCDQCGKVERFLLSVLK
jgi:hypothetical protein